MVSRRSEDPVSSSGPQSSRDSSSNKDLLHLEKIVTPLEKRLLECTNGEPQTTTRAPKRREAPAIGPIPESSVLGRIKSFLPVLDKANSKLMSDIRERGAEDFNVELVADSADRYVQMDLALGVADLYTPEAVAAAELAANGQILRLQDSDDTSEDSSSDSDEEDSDVEKSTQSSHELVEILRSPGKLGSDRERNGRKCRKIEPLLNPT